MLGEKDNRNAPFRTKQTFQDTVGRDDEDCENLVTGEHFTNPAALVIESTPIVSPWQYTQREARVASQQKAVRNELLSVSETLLFVCERDGTLASTDRGRPEGALCVSIPVVAVKNDTKKQGCVGVCMLVWFLEKAFGVASLNYFWTHLL